MNTFHLSLDVLDLDAAVAFYRELLGVAPAKEKPGYAKFELADPPLALALQEAGSPGLSHLGIRVGSTAEIEDASVRLKESGLPTFDERDVSCCYARQDKVWVTDPAGVSWEVYAVIEDVEDDEEHALATASCCAPGCCGG